MDNSQTMPTMSALVRETFTRREWLNYYLNIWQRNIAARIIDTESDRIAKEINPEAMVELNANQPEVAVKVRYEIRKQAVKDARGIIEATQSLLTKTDEELALLDGDDALKVSDDMLPTPAPVLPTEEETAAQAVIDAQSAPAEEVTPEAVVEPSEVKADPV